MQTYWDLTEKERAALTEHDVERFVDAELMTKGVLRAAPLELLPEPSLPEPDVEVFVVKSRRTYARVDVAFPTAEAARAALKGCRIIQSHYIGGQSVNSVDVIREPEVTSERIHSLEVIEQARSAFEKQGAIRSENDRRQRDHNEQTKKQREAVEGLWEDWHRCRAKATQMDRVLATFRDYAKLAGDENTARKFLGKAFDGDTIDDAQEWHGERLQPEPEIAEPPRAEPATSEAVGLEPT